MVLGKLAPVVTLVLFAMGAYPMGEYDGNCTARRNLALSWRECILQDQLAPMLLSMHECVRVGTMCVAEYMNTSRIMLVNVCVADEGMPAASDILSILVGVVSTLMTLFLACVIDARGFRPAVFIDSDINESGHGLRIQLINAGAGLADFTEACFVHTVSRKVYGIRSLLSDFYVENHKERVKHAGLFKVYTSGDVVAAAAGEQIVLLRVWYNADKNDIDDAIKKNQRKFYEECIYHLRVLDGMSLRVRWKGIFPWTSTKRELDIGVSKLLKQLEDLRFSVADDHVTG